MTFPLEDGPIEAIRTLAKGRRWRNLDDDSYCATVIVDDQLSLTLSARGYRDVLFSVTLRITGLDDHPMMDHPHMLAGKLAALLADVAARLWHGGGGA